MEAVIADADAARMQIVLYIDARNYLICSPGHYFDGPGKQASASFLRRWYGTFGFISDSDVLFKLGIFTTGVTDLIWMVREPELPEWKPTEDLPPMEMWLKLGFVRTDE